MPHQPELLPTEPSPEQIARNAEREKYLALLAEKLKDPAFRAIEGFPIAEDEAILALSDPPYYTACPNPFLPEIIERWQKEREASRGAGEQGSKGDSLQSPISQSPPDDYHREPFAADVSEGKNDPIYNAHSYHTKVPHKAIMRYILHYTEPGDIVFDGFAGTGMTGVAAQLCGDKKTVESLGYVVDDDGNIYDTTQAGVQGSKEAGGKSHPRTLAPPLPISKLGSRKAVLCDLSPAAYKGYASPATGGFTPPGIPGHAAGIALPYDPDRARRLLAEAGYPGGCGFPEVSALTVQTAWSYIDIESLQAQWRKNLGVEIAWQAMAWAAYLDRLNKKLPHLFLMAWEADYPDPDNFLRVTLACRGVKAEWQNEAFERLVEEAGQVTDQAERMKLYRQADKILVEEAAIMPLYYG
jgi:hypothetical protein